MFAMKQNLRSQAVFLQMPLVVFKRARDVGVLENVEVLQLCRSGRISWADMVLAPSVAGLFKWRQFEPEMILLAVGWYLRFSLSYRDVEELLAQRGFSVDHVTVWRWVQRYAPELECACAGTSSRRTTRGGWTRRTCG